jgi:hypothetical protein
MTVDVGMEFSGLKDALAELNSIDKKLRRQITKDFKTIVQPVVGRAESMLPGGAPLSGMARSWKGKSGADIMSWMDGRVKKNIKAFTSGKKVRDAPGGFKQNLGVFGVKWAGPQATIADMAAKGVMGENLTKKYGPPSRVVWKAYEMMKEDIDRKVQDLVNKVMLLTGNQGHI